MKKEELFLRFKGQSTEFLRNELAKYDNEIAKMVHIEDINTLLDAKEVIESILKERENGAQ